MLPKLVKNNAVALALVLPNLAISASTQWVCVVLLKWTGWMAFMAWGIGAGLGFEFGVVLAMFMKSNFKLGKWRYSYALPEKRGEVNEN